MFFSLSSCSKPAQRLHIGETATKMLNLSDTERICDLLAILLLLHNNAQVYTAGKLRISLKINLK